MCLSRPAWARGLKHLLNSLEHKGEESRPAWARGLKHCRKLTAQTFVASRPAWARGLKQEAMEYNHRADYGRAPHGRVD